MDSYASELSSIHNQFMVERHNDTSLDSDNNIEEISYSLDVYENDAAELTPGRKKYLNSMIEVV